MHVHERIQNDEALAALVAEHPEFSAFAEGHVGPASIPSEPAPLADDQEEKE